MNKRWHLYFSGKVQGVGMRFTCIYLAKEYKVTGWVKNLDDGRVELEVQGNEKMIETYLDTILERFDITKLEKKEIEIIHNETKFDLGW